MTFIASSLFWMFEEGLMKLAIEVTVQNSSPYNKRMHKTCGTFEILKHKGRYKREIFLY